MTIERIIQFIADLVKNKFTGRLILDMHNGDVSHRIKKEITEIVDKDDKRQEASYSSSKATAEITPKAQRETVHKSVIPGFKTTS